MTAEDTVRLHLNLDRVRWRKIDDMVQAIRIAGGQTAPAGYYRAVSEDPETDMGNDLLGSMMRNVGR